MLKQKAKIAVLWSGADVFLRQGLQFGVSIALVRLLSPEEFGTIALLYLFTGVAAAFVDSGFSAALIQRQVVTHTDESTVFWFNLAMALVVALVFAASAHSIALFFGKAILVQLIQVLALNIVITALGSVHGTLLTKRLDFKTHMKIGAIATVLSGAIGVGMALNSYGVWSLAGQTIMGSLVTTILLWFWGKWLPKLEFSIQSAKKLFGFGGYMFAAGLLDTIYSRAYTILIGKYFGVRELGFYNRADSTKGLPIGIMTGILARVTFPIFASIASNKNQLRRGVQQAVRGMMLINIPMMFGLAASAEQVILTLFGVAWLPSVPMLQVLCLAGVFWPLHVINLNVLMAQGHSSLFFRLEVVKKLMGTVLLLAGAIYGVMGIAWSEVVIGALAFWINAYYTQRHLDYGIFDQLVDILPTVGVSMLMGIFVYWLGQIWQTSPVIELAGLVLTGVTSFMLIAWLINLEAIQDVRMLLNRSGKDK